MESIRIELLKNHYSSFDATSIEMSILGNFLTTDVGFRRGYFFKEWALDENQFATGGDFSALEKEDGFVLIAEETTKWEEGEPYIKIPLDEFVKILDQWEEFCKTKPKEILITRENGVIKMEGKW